MSGYNSREGSWIEAGLERRNEFFFFFLQQRQEKLCENWIEHDSVGLPRTARKREEVYNASGKTKQSRKLEPEEKPHSREEETPTPN